jgi:hypothetical protein
MSLNHQHLPSPAVQPPVIPYVHEDGGWSGLRMARICQQAKARTADHQRGPAQGARAGQTRWPLLVGLLELLPVLASATPGGSVLLGLSRARGGVKVMRPGEQPEGADDLP